MTIIGIPTTRVSDLFVRDRVMRQVQYDQRELYRVQMQLSTGRRFQLPSESPVASLQVLSLQRLVERKDQVKTNLDTNQTFLTATDVAMSRISSIIAEARGVALSAIGTTASDTERSAAVQQIKQVTKQMFDAGNQKFRGRYLFAGTSTMTRPFEYAGENYVQYLGNERRLSSYADIDLLFDSNLTGSEVFGAVSAEVRGAALQPALSSGIRLADLRGGEGVSPGTLEISGGGDPVFVEIAGLETIGDVAAKIRSAGANLAGDKWLSADVTPEGLVVELHTSDGSPPGHLLIREVGGGVTAYELGILREEGRGPTVEGEPLRPKLRGTTLLADTLGTRATAFLHMVGADNDLVIEADRNGSSLGGTSVNKVEIEFVNDPLVVAGNETVELAGGKLTVRIEAGVTTAQQVIAAFEKYHDADSMPFRAKLDPTEGRQGLGVVTVTDPAAPVLTDWGSGQNLDQSHGLLIHNGEEEVTVQISTARTVEDLLNAVNGKHAGLMAEINDTGTGINLRSRYSGADFTIAENGGDTATQLGLRTFTAQTRLEDLNFGHGVVDYEGVGTTASATFDFNGTNNNLIFQARNRSAQWNDTTIRFEAAPPGGDLSMTYQPGPPNREIVFQIQADTTANDVIALFRATPGARDDFEIALDPRDGTPNTGTGVVAPAEQVTAGGDSDNADFSIIRRDGVVLEIDVNGAQTIQDVLDAINGHIGNTPNDPHDPESPPALWARLATHGNGIELVDNSIGSGALTVERAELSTAAIGLGLVPEGSESNSQAAPGSAATSEPVSLLPGGSLTVEANFPGTYANGVHVIFADAAGGAASCHYDPDPTNPTLKFTVNSGVTADELRGLLESDADADRLFSIRIEGNDGSGAVADTSPRQLSGGAAEVLTGADTNALETRGIFTALCRLQRALETNDIIEATRAIELLDESVLQMNFTRAELGARQEGLDVLKDRLDAEEIDLKESLSLNYDVDMVEVISQFTGRQAAFEASLRATAQISQMSLLNYL